MRSIRRSESVVFPWSMWAMIEKLRMFFKWRRFPGGPERASIETVILTRPGDHDHVELGAAEEEPVAARVQPSEGS